MSIEPLPANVVAQIKSSTTITSINGVVFGLAKNSLDAGSTTIEITIDYPRGGCMVEDNGLGILPSEFETSGGLGKLHHSSKVNSQDQCHGRNGCFLASLSAMSLLSITSRHYQYRSHNSITIHKSEPVSRQIPAKSQQYLASFDHGTRVTVRDLFGNMPVRVMQRALITDRQHGSFKEWESLKGDIILLLLAWPSPVVVSLHDVATSQKMLIKSPPQESPRATKPIMYKAGSILLQAKLISQAERQSMVVVAASTLRLKIQGVISLLPSATKQTQFIAFDIEPLMATGGRGTIHDEINRLFQNSAFGNDNQFEEPDDSEQGRRVSSTRGKREGYTGKELKKPRKSVDRWPIYYINIQQSEATGSNKLDIDDILDDRQSSLSEVIELTQAMILEFLGKYNFRPKPVRTKRRPKISQDRTSVLANDAVPRKLTTVPNVESSTRQPLSSHTLPNDRVMKQDLLGTSIKLPSFRTNTRPTSLLFDTWSHVKAGAIVSESRGTRSDSALLKKPHDIDCKSTVHLPSSKALTTNLVLPSGRIACRPFDDVESRDLERAKRATKSVHFEEGKTEESKGSQEDTVMKWVDPITKVEHLVNQRTGLSTAPSKHVQSSLTQVSSFKHPTCVAKKSKQAPSPWITSLLKGWENPVFAPAELSIPQVSLSSRENPALHRDHRHCAQIDIDRAFKELTSGVNGGISKGALRNSEVISQIDKKFLLVKVASADGSLLVIVDQHAADERIRVESLMKELCAPASLTTLAKPLSFEVSLEEAKLFRIYKPYFESWGIYYETSEQTDVSIHPLIIRILPSVIAERCSLQPHLLIDLLRTELYTSDFDALNMSQSNCVDESSWLARIHNCPQGIIDMVNSRACRSAIMFNDELSKEQCEILVRRLADCNFPFQCAHGRPSLVPLVELGCVGAGEVVDEGKDTFGRSFRNWKRELGLKPPGFFEE